jgi:hypothetical protein
MIAVYSVILFCTGGDGGDGRAAEGENACVVSGEGGMLPVHDKVGVPVDDAPGDATLDARRVGDV